MARIVVTDDAMFMRMQLKDMLTQAGHEVVGEAENGLQSVEQFKMEQPDLVTMDITMPEMDGIEALKKIKEIDANAKVIMCSAMGQQGKVVDAIKAGASDFVVKPLKEDRVNEAVQKALG
ncbi:response regulator [Desertibacillus haloalkaliphilus]|uniref:response regulator n=1 Tax=Desertibacillus haloalkaliphilus TaxID=1328930 RepID=UPI001C261953|nr:response regulator [Desertibacillus haloalkaliphilus]MBU8908152.1 response regulator [Desertibacillus haloalkaliphilus]